jgi:1-deoxy-D-xylulose-5-phosphate reductoisomerase
MTGVTILGSTGSVGVSTLEVLQLQPERFEIIALTAHRDVQALHQQCLTYRPHFAVMHDATAAQQLAELLQQTMPTVQVLAGGEALQEVASLSQVDYVMAAIVGAAGLLPTLAAIKAGKRVLLANKEALVMAGSLFMDEVRRHGAQLLPIDSEHNALFQCLPPHQDEATLADLGVIRLLLTGSGGPFRETPLANLIDVTPQQACAHPNWSMGRKISVDSATMMNKGLEVIEAHWLFNALAEQIQVVVHPQSIVHSMVEYKDGSVLAQLGNPDMRTPIAHALAWPQRMASGVAILDLFKVAQLTFQAPDFSRFPCLQLACAALTKGGTAPAILNAANEIAVHDFLDGCIRFTDIAPVIEYTLEHTPIQQATSLAAILASDNQARQVAQARIAALIKR